MLCATQCVDPSITVLGLALGDLLYGAVLTGNRFCGPEWGAWVTSNTGARLPAVMGFAVVVSFAYVLVNFGGGFALFVD